MDKDSYENSFENFLKLIHPEDRDYIEDTMKDPREEFLDMEFRIIRPDGDQRHIHQVVMFSFDENNKPYYAQGTIKDITEKSNLIRNISLKDMELRSIQKKYELLIKQSSDIFCIISKDYEIKYVNEVFERILGYEVENVGASNFLDYFDEFEKSELRGVIEKIKSGDRESIGKDIGVKTKYGQSRYLEMQVENSTDDHIVDGILINMRDITQRHNAEKRLKYLSTHDGLTDLANKRYLEKHIRELSNIEDFMKSRFSLMMIDIHEISDIGGSLGSKVEEELLFNIIDKISHILKEEDLLVRYSEYRLAILTSGFISEYHELAKDIVSIFSAPFITDQYELLISTSVGITIHPKDLNNEHSIIECAKIAMMQANQDGKNRYSFFSEDIDIYHYRKFMLRKDFKYAIANEQLRIRYQPIVDMNTNKLLAAEAFIVWVHPDWGEIESDEFLWLLSENNLIGDMENWAINKIFKDLSIWNSKKYPGIKIAINISSVQFYEKRFIETCSKKLEEYNLSGDTIIVKIDDKLLSQDSDKAKEIIDGLREIRIKVAIDSLRTGYFFLQYLNKFDVDILKLDRSFLEKSSDEEKNKIIFSSFVKLIKDLDLKLILEGIENWEQIKALYDLKIVAAQGPLFEGPIEISEFEKLLKQGKCSPKISKISNFSFTEERRKYYRIDFSQYLESDMSIMRIKDKKVNVGKSYALIEDIGPGGLAFISDIKFPVEKNMILEFKTELLNREVRTYGNLLWIEDVEKGIYKYGVEFTIDENDRDKLISILNQVQVKMKKDILFADGRFTNKSASRYFRKEN